MVVYTGSIWAAEKISGLLLKLKLARFFVPGRIKTSYVLSSLKSKLSDQPLIGIDVTCSHIYLSQISYDKKNISLTGLSSIRVGENNHTTGISTKPYIYSIALKKLLNSSDIKKAAICLPASSSIIKFVTIPKMGSSKIKQYLNNDIWQDLMKGYDRDDYLIHYQIIRKSSFAKTMEIAFSATSLKDLNLYKNIAIDANLNPIAINSKLLSIYCAFQKQIQKNTVIIGFGPDDNFVMVISDEGPHVFPVDIPENEWAAMLNNSNNGILTDHLLSSYQKKVQSIIESYKTIRPEVILQDIFVISTSSLIQNLIERLKQTLAGYNIAECNMFNYISIPNNFTISKESEKHNVSAWSAALCSAVSVFNGYQEEWVEVKKPATAPAFSNKIIKPKLINAFAVIAAICLCLRIGFSYYSLWGEERNIAGSGAFSDKIIAEYEEKRKELATLEDVSIKLEYIREQKKLLAAENNQFYILSVYNYFETILEHGVWLKQMTFTAPNYIEMEGRSLDEKNVMQFLGTLNDSSMFYNADLQHIQSIKELDLYRRKSLSLKSFVLKGKLAETLPGDYLNKASLIDKDMKKDTGILQ